MRLALFLLTLFSVLLPACGFDLINVEYDAKTFNRLAEDILKHSEIFQMDDFTRQNKSLNGIPIKLSEGDEHSSDQLLSEVQDSLGLNSQIVEDLRQQLQKTKLREFYRDGDTILFTVDGMLDTSWGFLYSVDNLKMDSSWFMFHSYSVLYTKDINKHWKKVAIK
jgi:hypothetical protein